MKLRLENGDFNIVVKNGAIAPIRKDLHPYQLLGVVFDNAGVLTVITAVTPAQNGATYTLTAGSTTLTYTVATGAVAVSQ